ncbi:MAG: EAL domain-containing protein [Ilumatobacteraceae bacterium]
MSVTDDPVAPRASGCPAERVERVQLLARLERAQRSGLRAGVIHLDLDRFHQVNTRFGHEVGDLVLAEVARRVLTGVPDQALVANVDRDAFVVGVLGADPDATRTTAEHLLAVIRQPITVDDQVVVVHASAGLACRAAGDRRVDLVERAFVACRKAKATAPGTVVGYEGALGAEADRRQRIEDGLRRALVDRELRLLAQPKVDLSTGAVVGVEALLRWQHPTDGLLVPAAFLPAAESVGLMVVIGDWVLDEAIELAARWRTRRDGAPIRVWVNLAAQQLAAGEHVRDRVHDAISSGRITPQSIGFEVTESSLLEDLPSAVGVLSALRDLGVELALDDFGTGYSPLSYLRQLPVTTVKIDQQFVAGIGGSLADEVIVEAVIDLAHALGLRVVAEGVEHVGQADALVRMGADSAQGFHFGRPMDPDLLDPLIDLPWCGAAAPTSGTTSTRADELPQILSPRTRLLLSAFDTAHDSVMVTAAVGGGRRPPIVYVNDAFEAETGFRREQVIGESIDMLLLDPADPADLAWFEHVQVGAGPATRELASRRADGSTYLCELTISPISDERGVHTHWLHVRRDLTQRRAAEGARARFQGLIEQTTSLVFLAETGGQWVYANAAQRRAIGLAPDDPLHGVNTFTLFSADQAARLEAEVFPALRSTGQWSGTAVFVDPGSGRRTEVVMDVQVVEDPLRPGTRIFAAVSRDVTDENERTRVEQRRRELGTFAADVAHGAMHRSSNEFLHDLDEVLARFGALIRADRLNVNSIDMDTRRVRSIAHWSSPRYPPVALPDEVSVDLLPRWVARLAEGGMAFFDASSTDDWAVELRQTYPGIESAGRIFASLRVEGELLGVLVVGTVDPEHRWTDDELDTISQVADTLANLLVRQRAADALALSERRLTAMLANLSDVLLVLDASGTIKYVNDQAQVILGHRPTDVVDRHFLELVHPDDHSVAIDSFAQTLAGGELPVTELRVRHADGSYVWFDADTSGEYDELLGGYLVSMRNMSLIHASMADADRQAELERVVLDLSQWALEVEPDDIINGLHVHLEHLGRAMRADVAFAALFDGDSVRNVAGWSASGDERAYVFPDDGPTMPAIVARYRTLEPLVVSDIEEHDEPWADEWRSFPVPDRAGLNVPLVSEGRCLGNLGVAMATEVREWTRPEIAIVQRASATVSALLARRQVETSLRSSEARLGVLLDVAQLALDRDAGQFIEHLPEIGAQVGDLLEVDYVYVDRLDEHQQRLVNLAGWIRAGVPPGLERGQAVTFDSIPHWIERLRQPGQIVVSDARGCDEAWVVEKRDSMGVEGGMMAVPMVSNGELFGVVGVSMAGRARSWTDDDVAFLRIVAETISHVLERSLLDAALRSSEARFRLLSETAADVVVLFDGDGVITYVSPSSTFLVGRSPDELIGSHWRDLVHPADRAAVVAAGVQVEATGSFSSEMRLLRADGSAVWVVNSTSKVLDPATGRAMEYRTSVRDISERKRLEAELERQALHDPLTGLANRILLHSRLEVATARRGATNDVSVLLIDLDGFKEVNDTWGHAVGDEVLQVVASRLRSLARPSDTVARTGGDEFVVLCPETDRAGALSIARRIVESIGVPLSVAEVTVHLGASVGVAHQRGGTADPDALLMAADHAMYTAKRTGGDGVAVAPEMTAPPTESTVLR